ncbi:hypothetical protein [Brevundimonas sp.]|uniref:hypothetical protein n=1 Tax=Brevundimonas sp. TaxID=1871086 RepID=UPI0028A09B3E|nr:hypothetical protein [Brevundimonas sp.]
MGAVVTTNRDLSDEGNRIQARYELNRALDCNDIQQLAEWARNWGEGALDRSEEGHDFTTPHVVTMLCGRINTQAEQLLAKAQEPDVKIADLIDLIRSNFRDIDHLDAMLAGV